jgi:hypothetical protein
MYRFVLFLKLKKNYFAFEYNRIYLGLFEIFPARNLLIQRENCTAERNYIHRCGAYCFIYKYHKYKEDKSIQFYFLVRVNLKMPS